MLQLRQGPLPRWEDSDTLEYVRGQEDDLIISNIRRNWHDLFQSRPRPRPETLSGVLGTLLHSNQVWGSPSPQSRGYLHYMEGFLKKAGASV